MLKTSLWDISIYTDIIPDYHLIKDNLVKAIYEYDKNLVVPEVHDGGIGPWPQRHKPNLKESDHLLFESDNEYIQHLKAVCGNSLAKVLHRCVGRWYNTDTYSINFQDSWYHITKNGGYHDIHDHGESTWCGIFYVDIGESDAYNANGINRFYSPLDVRQEPGMEHLALNNHDVTPTNGKLVIFPGFLKHSAVPYYGTKDRIVVSFNAKVEVPDD